MARTRRFLLLALMKLLVKMGRSVSLVLPPSKNHLFNDDILQPFGKIGAVRKDIEISSKSKTAGGTGIGMEFWEWSEKQVSSFV